jgi:thioredoxin-like negative regulator of GroEL
MSELAYVLVPESEVEEYKQVLAEMPQDLTNGIGVLVVPDALYNTAKTLIESGEMEEILAQGADALLHRLKLGDNAITSRSLNSGT